ncbi:MAG TPA: hypothetical protein VJU61_28380, partial [Polyangiaceae bacterium]|nr:hypothetical protein [Polyangiaceae bacterium]
MCLVEPLGIAPRADYYCGQYLASCQAGLTAKRPFLPEDIAGDLPSEWLWGPAVNRSPAPPSTPAAASRAAQPP